MPRELDFARRVEQALLTDFRKPIWRPFMRAVRDYRLIEAGENQHLLSRLRIDPFPDDQARIGFQTFKFQLPFLSVLPVNNILSPRKNARPKRGFFPHPDAPP